MDDKTRQFYAGKAVLITGVNSGIGRALAGMLVDAGASVFGVSRNADTLKQVAAQFSGKNGKFVPYAADLSGFAACQDAVSRCIAAFGRMDILINNAGIGHFSAFEKMPRDEYEYVLNTNLLTPIHLASLSLDSLKASGAGRIINICSSGAFYGIAFRGIYCASKAGMRAWCQAIAVELTRHKIEVHWVIPGATKTEFFANSLGLAPQTHRIPDKVLPPEILAAKILRNAVGKGKELMGSWPPRIIVFLAGCFPFLLKQTVKRMTAAEERFIYGEGR